jgi:hypothetical protein
VGPSRGVSSPVIHVETIDLSLRGVTLPSDRVGMVIAQPHLSLTATEPYRCTPEAKPHQMRMITDTLDVAAAAGHGALKTYFTVFPEYSIPGTDGIASLEAVLSSPQWPVGTVVIGGTDALSKSEFSSLVAAPNTNVGSANNSLSGIGDEEWINCGITWVKAQDGRLERWLQPKLHPAWEEMNISYQSMFCGHTVYVFKGLLSNGAPYRFATLVCFDWIASIESKKTVKWILEDLQRQANAHQLPFSWLFVIQRNPKPSHGTFLREVEAFFDPTEFPNALRDRACLIFANNAGKATPGKSETFGGCSLVLSQQSGFTRPDCALTFSNGGPRFRDGSDLLSPFKDVFFRERGACIHSFVQIGPGSLPPGPAGRSLPVENAHVHPIDGVADPRTPSAGVPAAVKWLNDELDDLPSLAVSYPALPLNIAVETTHKQTVAALRVMPANSVAHAVKLAAQESTARNADQWDRTEFEAIEHLVNTLDIVSLGAPAPAVAADPAHATLLLGNQAIDLLAIRGISHQACIEHSKTLVALPRRKSLLISRDRDNNPWSRKFGSFLDPENAQLGQEQKFTDPASGSLHLGYRKLLDIFQASATANAVQGAIDAELSA